MNIKKTIALISAGALMAGVGAIAAQQPVRAQARPMHRAHHEGHPSMDAALQQLNAARASLQTGAHDFGGHRLRALSLVNQAIFEVHQALATDRR